MSIIDDFKPYVDRYGLSCLDKGSDGYGVTSQNGALFTMQYLFCLRDKDPENFQSEVDRVKKVFDKLEKEPGLSRRFFHSTEVDSMDNQAALLTFSALFDNGRYANDCLSYGERTICEEYEPAHKKYFYLARFLHGAVKYCWNVEKPKVFNLRGWWGRSPGFLGMLKMTSNKPVSIFENIAVFIGQFVGVFRPLSDCDARTLPFITWQYLRTRSPVWEVAYNFWDFILRKQYGGGIGQVYARYYLDKDHPLLRYTKDDKAR